jgi:hypothetical protein
VQDIVSIFDVRVQDDLGHSFNSIGGIGGGYVGLEQIGKEIFEVLMTCTRRKREVNLKALCIVITKYDSARTLDDSFPYYSTNRTYRIIIPVLRSPACSDLFYGLEMLY